MKERKIICPHCTGHIPLSTKEERFWSQVDKSKDCWEWVGYRNRTGYGQVAFTKAHTMTHRISWILTYGEIPDGMLVCHKCDNPPCCNPEHLFLGTNADNARDKAAKGRSYRPTGEKSVFAKLTEQSVRNIRAEYNPEINSYNDLAIKYGVSKNTIRMIVLRRKWTHI
jgi:hypothetical protein